ncbi:hypothetical protein [Methylocaldum sp.]|uniref:hypothetical protein n=1 Tax=Methylocaldum sp. TaxID=1969727 RepID=UPI002D71814A|nr:hypothetical protein [Methylocaldum sp.]HYE38072.1 hypothetical protein [Methylocaldum sp.]
MKELLPEKRLDRPGCLLHRDHGLKDKVFITALPLKLNHLLKAMLQRTQGFAITSNGSINKKPVILSDALASRCSVSMA